MKSGCVIGRAGAQPLPDIGILANSSRLIKQLSGGV
jgi:hypothetical protein